MQRLSDGDAPALQGLVEQCGDYYTLVEGAPADGNEAQKLLSELPPGRTLADKYLFGVYERTELAGVIEVVRGYREAGEWWLGVMLLRPSARKHGRGTLLFEELVGWLRSEGCKSVRIAVAEQNVLAVKFWQRHGFNLVKRHPARQMTARATVLLELQREL